MIDSGAKISKLHGRIAKLESEKQLITQRASYSHERAERYKRAIMSLNKRYELFLKYEKPVKRKNDPYSRAEDSEAVKYINDLCDKNKKLREDNKSLQTQIKGLKDALENVINKVKEPFACSGIMSPDAFKKQFEHECEVIAIAQKALDDLDKSDEKDN